MVCVTHHPALTIAGGSCALLKNGQGLHIKSAYMYLHTSLVLRERPDQEGISSGWDNMEIHYGSVVLECFERIEAMCMEEKENAFRKERALADRQKISEAEILWERQGHTFFSQGKKAF